LSNAGLFLAQLTSWSKQLKQLISPRLGNSVYFAQQLLHSAPKLDSANIDQIAALSMGARLKFDPYTGSISFLKSKPVRLLSVREKMPFEVTPLLPVLTRQEAQTPIARPATAASDTGAANER